MSLPGREVILGIGGGIAAYKACDLLRRLQDDGFLVTVVPTPAALNFVGSATWEALSGRPVYTQVWENISTVPHVTLAKNADFIIIAPATADLIARLTHGRADDLLTNVVLSSEVPKILVPAMHPAMWKNPATIANVETLRSRGFHIIEPDTGRLTGSDSGQGRFPETARILERFHEIVGRKADLLGKRILISAGGTREAIDPVRFIGNRSSGKQGFAIAAAAVARGATVHLVAANSSLPDIAGVSVERVESTQEMGEALERQFSHSDILIMSAAVADARPVTSSKEKIKKDNLHEITLVSNPDLLAGLAGKKSPSQRIVGFAAETGDLIANAQSKLLAKGLDLVYVNDVSGGAIFGSEETSGTLIAKDGSSVNFVGVSKDTLANALLDQLLLQIG